jgi:hypothetical protein
MAKFKILKFPAKCPFPEKSSLVLESLAFSLDGRPSRSGLRGRRRTYLTIFKSAWSANFKMVCYVLLRRLRP